MLTLESGPQLVYKAQRLLVTEPAFRRVNREDVAFARDWALGPSMQRLAEGNSRIGNGDMKFGHVFGAPDEFRFVDWAVPLRGPAEIDLVQLLEDRDIDPLNHVDPDVVALRWFLFLRWAIEGKTRLLPEEQEMFDEWAAMGLAKMRAAVRKRTKAH